MRFGLLLPRFGEFATPDRLLRAAQVAEQSGFDSVWVRDHLLWTPHGFEGHDPTFIDPFVTLSAAAAVTERVNLGTTVVIPTRWPLKLAQDFASLHWLSRGRAICGIGLGFDPKEFAGSGFNFAQKNEILTETIDILRLAWTKSHASYSGTVFSFEDVTIEPKPTTAIPIEYGGTSPAGLRRAVQYTEGWQVGRLPLKTLDKRLVTCAELEERHGKTVAVRIQPLVVLARREADARARVPVAEIGKKGESSKFWDFPGSGSFDTIEDLEGLVACGTPGRVVEEIRKLETRRITEFILDLRLQFDMFDEALDLFIQDVLPHFKRATSSTPAEPTHAP